jgi:transposase
VYAKEIAGWIAAEPRITAKRVLALLAGRPGLVGQRATAKYLKALREELTRPKAFVHRTHAPGDAMEVDFGQSFARLCGVERRIHFLVATLPASNAYFAKAYLVERLECLLDGIAAAVAHFGGLPRRMVLDNTSLAVKRVLAGREREETDAFHGFRGGYGLAVDFCAPAAGWEKGSVEAGVRYVRDTCLRPMPVVATMEDLNAMILVELRRDEDRRRLADGRSVTEALAEEREHLRPVPAHEPESCRTLARVADKFGHVRFDTASYSVPIDVAYRPVLLKVFAERIEIARDADVVARHERSFVKGALVLDPLHVLPLLEQKSRAAREATALRGLPLVFEELRLALVGRTRHPDREWVQVLRLAEAHGMAALEGAAREALARGSPRLETVRALLRPAEEPRDLGAVPITREDLARIEVAAPDLAGYDVLLAVRA